MANSRESTETFRSPSLTLANLAYWRFEMRDFQHTVASLGFVPDFKHPHRTTFFYLVNGFGYIFFNFFFYVGTSLRNKS
jgi:hypothetical protein